MKNPDLLTKNNHHDQGIKKYFFISLPLLFFIYQFILRMWMGQVQDYEIHRLSLNVQQFGSINTAYYAGYTLAQIPIAILLGRYSSSWIIFLFSFLTTGCFFLGLVAPSLEIAIVARFFVGCGSVVGILGLSRIVSAWIHEKKYSSFFGLTISLGLLGLPLGKSPIAQLISYFHRNSGGFLSFMGPEKIVGLILVVFGVFLCFMILFFLREPAHRDLKHSSQKELKISDLGKVMSSTSLWVIGLVSLLLVGTLQGMADVWGENFLEKVHHFTKIESSFLMSFSFFGIIAGTTIVPLVGERIGHFATVLLAGLLLAVGSLGFIFFPVDFPMGYIFIGMLTFFLGILSGYQTNLFSFGAQYSPKNTGNEIVVAFVNCINMAGGSFFHFGIPAIMNYFWHKEAHHHNVVVHHISSLSQNALDTLRSIGLLSGENTPLYKPFMYQYGLLFVPFSALLGVLLLFVFFFNKKKS